MKKSSPLPGKSIFLKPNEVSAMFSQKQEWFYIQNKYPNLFSPPALEHPERSRGTAGGVVSQGQRPLGYPLDGHGKSVTHARVLYKFRH